MQRHFFRTNRYELCACPAGKSASFASLFILSQISFARKAPFSKLNKQVHVGNILFIISADTKSMGILISISINYKRGCSEYK